MKKTDLLIIGGSAGGILTATTARKTYGSDIDITLIRQTRTVMVPCGIPYIYGTLGDVTKNRIPDTGLEKAGVHVLIDTVTGIDREKKEVETRDSGGISYRKLVIATGSLPIIPTFIPGYDLENVFSVKKEEEYLAILQEKIAAAQHVAVIGGGFIGVEFAEQVRTFGKDVTLIEMEDACLWQAFDKEYSDDLEGVMKDNGIRVMTGTKVKCILGDTKVASLELDNGDTIPADLVILGLGVKPNGELAGSAGLERNAKGAVVVDQYMRTSDPDIFAVGDCAEKKCFFTGKDAPVLLASTAAMEAKIAGCNAFRLCLIRANKGTISTFSTQLYGKTYAAAGLTESRARAEGFDMIVGRFSTMDRHPGSLPGAQQIRVKLIFSRGSGILLGAQMIGGNSVAEMINILSLAILKDITATELYTFQTATHPLVTASPIAYPINAAASDALTLHHAALNGD